MAGNVFEVVKHSVSAREAAQMYGIEVRRNGMACCPFHDDKNPSMKLDRRFHCFGCGADGDAIDFTARLYNLSPKEAAEKLAQDFGLIYDSQAPPRKNYVPKKSEAQKFKEDHGRCFRVLSDYYHLLKKWETEFAPKTPEEDIHPRFAEALHQKEHLEYLLDLLLYESAEEQKAWIAGHTAEIENMERRMKKMAEKPTNKERLREITEGIEQGIKELFESEKYMRYLSVMSRFHRYSVNNTMLIYMQKPDATLVCGYNKWKNQFERHVKKGEHGITIIAPTPFKKKIEEQKLDPDTKAPILDKDGKIVTEEREIEIPMFRPVKVFDYSQTDGKPLPELASALSGNVQNFEAFMEALRRTAPVPITFEAMAADMDGYFSSDNQKIAIRQGMSEVQTVSAAVHEIAHSKLHNLKQVISDDKEKYQEIELFDKPGLFSNGRISRENLPDGLYVYDLRGSDYDPGDPVCVEERVVVNHAGAVILSTPLELPEQGYLPLTEESGLNFTGGEITISQFLQEQKKDRHTEEVEAESISYAVCQYYGIQTGENSFGYIASWSQGKELKELRASLETINKTSCELISDIDRHYKEICKERGIDLTAAKEPERDPIEQLAVEIDQFYSDYDPYEYKDRVDDREDALTELTAMLRSEAASDVRNWLQEFVDENESGEAFDKATELLERLNQLVPEAETKQLAQTEPDMFQEEPDPNLVRMADEAMAQGLDVEWKSSEEFPLFTSVPEPDLPSTELQEALLVLDDTTYLHIQPCDTGWDYTLYDVASMKQLDGGQLDEPELPRSAAVLRICEDLEMGSSSIKYAPVDMIETLQDAEYRQMQEQADAFSELSPQLPDAPEQSLDEYPMPDSELAASDMEQYGYLYDGMLPVSKERALELDAAGLTVYVLHEDNTESMVFDSDEILQHGGLFGVDREEWEHSPEFHEKVLERQDRQLEREQAFLSHEKDCFAIYQVSEYDPQRLRFMNLDWLQSHNLSVERGNYDLIYTAPLQGSGTATTQLETLYHQFNMEKPVDFHSPSMSVSDIVALKQNGVVSCHYCDSVGFTEIPGFLPDNALKNAEMSVEDDYGMIDGIINNGPKEPTVAQLEQQARNGQPISLMDLAAAAHREERDKKKSVVEQLKSQPKTEHKKTAPKKSAEREI